jgi:UDP-N-acetylglucosamine/UDP-N-acetylgalactosamine diphosphorylase
MVDEAIEVGHGALQRGEVAVMTPMGGRSTRYGGIFRGDVRLDPVLNASILELQGHRMSWIRKVSRGGLFWVIMESDFTKDALGMGLRRYEWFGFAPSKVITVRQPLYHVVTNDGHNATASNGDDLLTPGGNGALAAALAGELGVQLRLSGVRYLVLFNYSNILERVCDPLMIGWHILTSADITLKACHAIDWQEPAGRVARSTGAVKVIEYHYARYLSQTYSNSTFPIWTGSAVITFPARFLGAELSWHRVRHTEPGDLRLLWRSEQFIHEIAEYANSVKVLYCNRALEYAPVKSGRGYYSLDSALRQLKDELTRCELTELDANDSRISDLRLRQ